MVCEKVGCVVLKFWMVEVPGFLSNKMAPHNVQKNIRRVKVTGCFTQRLSCRQCKLTQFGSDFGWLILGVNHHHDAYHSGGSLFGHICFSKQSPQTPGRLGLICAMPETSSRRVRWLLPTQLTKKMIIIPIFYNQTIRSSPLNFGGCPCDEMVILGQMDNKHLDLFWLYGSKWDAQIPTRWATWWGLNTNQLPICAKSMWTPRNQFI